MIITLEEFPVYLPGAYGNRNRRTPGLDTLSLETTVFDRVYSTTADPLATLEQLWRVFRPEPEVRWALVTDDDQLAPPAWAQDAFVTTSELFWDTDAATLHEMEERTHGARLWLHFRDWDLDALDRWLTLDVVRSRILAVLGTSGETPDAVDTLLYQAEIQLPWWVRFDAPELAATRCPALVTPEDFQTLRDLQDPDVVLRDRLVIHVPPRFAVATDAWFLTGLDAEHDSEPGAEPFPPELYVKPHDWWEQNDVASRCADEIAALLKFH